MADYFKFFHLKHLFLALLLLFIAACKTEKKPKVSEKSEFCYIQSLDTLKIPERKISIATTLNELSQKNKSQDQRLMKYLLGYQMVLNQHKDSALVYFQNSQEYDGEWKFLQKAQILSLTIPRTGIVSAELTKKVYETVRKAENQHSIFTYKLYDLLAMIYYNNHNAAKAREFNEKYFRSHPFQNSNFIRQRYHDISFLVNERIGDFAQMREHFEAARELAIQSKDSTALMRTYEYESRINMDAGQWDSAIINMRKYLDFSEKNKSQIAFIYSNMGLMYLKNNQLDSARIYYQRAIDWKRKNESEANTINAYQGLSKVYAAKKDFAKAYAYLDSMVVEKEINDQQVRDKYVEQLQAEYAVEKKDKEIENLKLTNLLNQRIIHQTRWTIGIGIILLILGGMYLFTLFRRHKLNHRNKKLEYENRSLILEQRLTQMQINPHFIHNAIANLQGLIVQDEKKTANRYLIALSKLIRNILELNRQELITISEEIESLENYLKLQQMRMKDAFYYEIDSSQIDPDSYMLPPMLLQPFIENAIEHGFSNLDYPGKLNLRFIIKIKKLHIQIIDNGNKSEDAGEVLSNKKSLSQTIIQERLDLLFNTQEKQAWYEAGQNKNAENGYEVNIYLPIIEA